MPPGDLHGLLRLLWRKPKPVDADTREQRARFRGLPDPPQPAPYWVIDLGPLVLVGIDTGISGQLDRDQGDWLARVSREIDKPKVLVTGKPLIVDGQYHPGPIERSPHGSGDRRHAGLPDLGPVGQHGIRHARPGEPSAVAPNAALYVREIKDPVFKNSCEVRNELEMAARFALTHDASAPQLVI